jgi:hypothetical protein
MPNWCDNSFRVSHSDPKQITRFVDAFKRGELCNEFIPVPEELKGSVADGKTNEALVEATGYSSWYDFCVNEWGTKWDVGGDDGYIDHDETSAQGSFQSAWSPPMGLMVVLEQQGFTVEFMYYEPGMNYAGVYRDGSDDYYELAESSDEVREQLPEDLDLAFGISENMAEWEEENDE